MTPKVCIHLPYSSKATQRLMNYYRGGYAHISLDKTKTTGVFTQNISFAVASFSMHACVCDQFPETSLATVRAICPGMPQTRPVRCPTIIPPKNSATHQPTQKTREIMFITPKRVKN